MQPSDIWQSPCYWQSQRWIIFWSFLTKIQCDHAFLSHFQGKIGPHKTKFWFRYLGSSSILLLTYFLDTSSSERGIVDYTTVAKWVLQICFSSSVLKRLILYSSQIVVNSLHGEEWRTICWVWRKEGGLKNSWVCNTYVTACKLSEIVKLYLLRSF